MSKNAEIIFFTLLISPWFISFLCYEIKCEIKGTPFRPEKIPTLLGISAAISLVVLSIGLMALGIELKFV